MTCEDCIEETTVVAVLRRASGRRFLSGAVGGCAVVLSLLACNKPPSAAVESASAESAPPVAAPAPVIAPAEPTGTATVGQPAPDFTLSDIDGKAVSLSQFRGKVVVLEWFNPGCPFVRAAHTGGSLKGFGAKQTSEGVVWLAINSAGSGKQGHDSEANRKAQSQFGMPYPVLVDESGSVGQLYGAERTPHMFVINAEGILVYRGAIDNSPDGEGQSPEGGKLVNYVEGAIAAVRGGAKVTPAETKPYGCTVKYKDL